VIALVCVIVGLVIGITVYAIVNYVRRQQTDQMVNPRAKAYMMKQNETEFTQARKDESIAELPQQFDAHKIYDDPNSACKMVPNDSTINDLCKDGDTERLEKSIIEGSSGLEDSTLSENSGAKNLNKRKMVNKKQSHALHDNEDVEIQPDDNTGSNSGSSSDINKM